jgi:hypothetical protein
MAVNWFKLYKIDYIYIVLTGIVNTFFVLYLLGFLKNKNELVEKISMLLKLFIGIFLTLKYNPFYKLMDSKFTEFDKNLVFSAGVYIILINSIVAYNSYIINKKMREEKIKNEASGSSDYPSITTLF